MEERFARRRRLLEALPASNPHRVPALAFCTLDERTDPKELRRRRQVRLARYIELLTDHLVIRSLQRASWVLHWLPFEPAAAVDASYEPMVDEVEPVFRKALLDAFPGQPGRPFDVRRFEQAFAAFVAGELRLGTLAGLKPDDLLFNDGVPDGANLFCFAEAALYFIRLRKEPAFWGNTLPAFVCGASFFAANFWEPPQREWTAYKPAELQPMASQPILAMMDHCHRGMDLPSLAQRFGETLALALRDDHRISRPVPGSREFP